MKTFCGVMLAAIAVVVAHFHVHMSPNSTFSTVPLRGFPNQELLVKLNAPAGYEGKLKIDIDGSSAVGGGKIVGDNEVKFDGGEPVSKGRSTFGIDKIGLYRLRAEIDGETVVSHIITIAPETQCNGKQWFYVSSCDDCVHLTDLNCQYCPGLQTCVKGNIHGPYDPVACPEWFVSVCFVPGNIAWKVSAVALGVLAVVLLSCCCCFMCSRGCGRDQSYLSQYDTKFNLDHSNPNYGATSNNVVQYQENRERIASKYNIHRNR